MKYCGECGAELSDDMKFCDVCGEKQAESPTKEKQDKPDKKPSTPEKSAKKKSKKPVAIILTLLIILGIGFGAYYYFFLSDSAIYSSALKMYEQKDYNGAIQTFNSIIDYQDSKEKINEISYEEASLLYENGDNEEALAIFESLGQYSNSAELVLEIKNELTYQQALDEEANGNAQEALNLLNELGEYKDSVLISNNLSKGLEFGVYDPIINGEWIADTESIATLNSSIIEGENSLKFNSDGTAELILLGETLTGEYAFTDKVVTIGNQTLNRLFSDNDTAYLEAITDEEIRLIFKAKNNEGNYISETPDLAQETLKEASIAAYEEFISSEKFKEVISDDVTFMSSKESYKYVIKDMQGDGVEELLIVAGVEPEWNHNFFFSYNLETKSVELIDFFRTFGDIMHSPKHNAITFEDMQVFMAWQVEFYTLTQNTEALEFEKVFSLSYELTTDNSTKYTLSENGTEKTLSHSEATEYLDELNNFEFIEITSSASETASIIYVEPEYDQVLTLFSDGTFELYVAAYSSAEYVYGTYYESNSGYSFNVTSNTLYGIGKNVYAFGFDRVDSNTLMFNNLDQIGALTYGTYFYLE